MSATPAISVILPSYRRRATLEQVLGAWERQRPSSLAFEVVVVDDGSDDGTLELLGHLRPRRFALRFASQHNAGPASARNRGLELARAPLVLFAGDDIEPEPDLLAVHVDAHQRDDDEGLAVLGLTRWPGDCRLTATMRHIDGIGAQQFSYHGMRDGEHYDFRHLYTSNISLRRSLLGPERFATHFPAAAFEDAELGHRLTYRGLRIVYHAAAVARHHHPYDAASFYRRQARCGAMAAILFVGAPELERWTQLRALSRVRLSLLGAPHPDDPRLDRLAANWPRWRRRAIDLARRVDAADPPGVDPLLHALFQLGFLEGLAEATWSQPTAHRVLARVYAETLPPALDATARALARVGVPLPESDRRAIAALAA
ncbi:MAG: glycosyltransferase family 2 protein [Acidobacteriota bacterium]